MARCSAGREIKKNDESNRKPSEEKNIFVNFCEDLNDRFYSYYSLKLYVFLHLYFSSVIGSD